MLFSLLDWMCYTSGTRTMSLCLLEFWGPLHKVRGAFASCMGATVMNQSMTPSLDRVALERKGPQRRPQEWLDRQLERIARRAVEGGHCRLQVPLPLAVGVREGGGGGYLPLPIHP